SNVVPVVLLAGVDGVYWDHWRTYIDKNLLGNGWISPEDMSLIHLAESPQDACEHILQFYKVYHSSRYVGDHLVLRLKHALSEEQMDALNDDFADLVHCERIELSGALPGETDHLELPRLVFHHTRRAWGRVRQLIDRVNSYGADDS
ncbi:MAG: hypothetical protein MK095_11105, partial [Phycisphaerales bacterium]|nr:hypothetical protein [Phycisphaerales bacterium]